MRWVKHFTDARRDPVLLAVKRRMGFAGVGMYWALVEAVGEQYKADSDPVVDLDYTSWRELTGIPPQSFKKLVAVLQEVHENLEKTSDFSSSLLEKSCKIFWHKIKEIRDNHTRHLQATCNQEEEEDIDVKKPPTPLNGDCVQGDLLEPQEQPKPKAKGRKKKAACAPEYSDSFEAFWELYPRKENKVTAYESWKAIGESGRAKVSDIMAGLRAQLEHGSFSEDPKRRPYPSTWLNNARWEDEVSGNGSSPAAAWVKNADGVMVRREGKDWVDENGYIQPGPEK